MVEGCVELQWSTANAEPAPLDRRPPGVADWFEGDASEDIDCLGAGITITNAVAAIRGDDDDGLLTLGAVTFSGLTFRVNYTVDADDTQRMYGITVTVTTSAGRTLYYDYSLPIVPTRWLHA